MKRQLIRVLLCAALLGPALAPRLAMADDKELNAFNQYSKKDLKYHGAIAAIDATAGTVTVKNKDKGPLTLTITKDTLLFANHKKGPAALGDFKVGEDVHVLYAQAGAAITCDSMWHPGASPAEKQRELENKTP
jgi:hypothetical protein